MNRSGLSPLSLALAACVFGGPSDDANLIQPLPAPGAEASGGSAAKPAREGTEPDTAAVAADAGETLEASAEPSTDTPECQQTILVCDPVHNTGCTPLLQCDVDPAQTQTPTGRCVFRDTLAVGACATTLLAQSCEPGHTCVDTVCRTLCHCDADCPVGQCCQAASGAAGFLLCEPCS